MTPARGASEGLDALDELRAASLADEGGTSAATLESRAASAAGLSKPGALALFCAGAALLAVRPGENRVEARLTQAGGRPGHWRFELQEKGRIEPGSLRILQGEVTQVTGDAVAFRLRGQPGETVAFSFRLAPQP